MNPSQHLSDTQEVSKAAQPLQTAELNTRFNHDGRALILPTTAQDGPGFELKDRWRR